MEFDEEKLTKEEIKKTESNFLKNENSELPEECVKKIYPHKAKTFPILQAIMDPSEIRNL